MNATNDDYQHQTRKRTGSGHDLDDQQQQQQQRRRPDLSRNLSSCLFKAHLSTFDIARLTVCMLGVQFTWAVELGYGTPYLLSLGIPKSLTPLVWLAGPLSGLIIQPLVGVFSDTLDWKMGRRRPFILTGAVLTILSMYMVAYSKDLARCIVSWTMGTQTNGGVEQAIKGWTIGFAVVGFYCLDFSINAVQASCRSLIMDIPRTDQQETCNAWSGWMTNLGSVAGFFAGNLDLVHLFPWLADTQIKALANMAIVCFSITLAISCLSVKEIPYEPTDEDKKSTTWVAEILNRVHSEPDDDDNGLLLLSRRNPFQQFQQPPPIPAPSDPNNTAERAGSFALLCWAGMAVVTGITIPRITPQELGRERWPRNPFTLRNLWTMSLVWFACCMGMTWFVDDLWAATMVIALCGVPWAVAMWVPFAMVGEILSDMKDRLALRDYGNNHSTASSLEDSATVSTRYGTVTRAKHGNGNGNGNNIDHDGASISTGNSHRTDNDDDADDFVRRQEALSPGGGSNSLVDTRITDVGEDEEAARSSRDGSIIDRDDKGLYLGAGLMLGVHNMYIVFPQFVDALVASCLFALIGAAPTHEPATPEPRLPGPGPGGPGDEPGLLMMPSWSTIQAIDPEPVGWVLRFGGLMALVAAYLSRRL
ncbi:hypothetical protein BGZ94_002152 [Podila epigama]|nr:hypothetical protein BGZ94_002152 [Podila epigama]